MPAVPCSPAVQCPSVEKSLSATPPSLWRVGPELSLCVPAKRRRDSVQVLDCSAPHLSLTSTHTHSEHKYSFTESSKHTAEGAVFHFFKRRKDYINTKLQNSVFPYNTAKGGQCPPWGEAAQASCPVSVRAHMRSSTQTVQPLSAARGQRHAVKRFTEIV